MNAATLCQRLEYRLPPLPGARKPVHEDDRFALAGDPVLDRRAVHHELPNLHGDQCGSRGRLSTRTLVIEDDGAGEKVLERTATVVEQRGQDAGEQGDDRKRQADQAHQRASH
jgi:hypothetical protein